MIISPNSHVDGFTTEQAKRAGDKNSGGAGAKTAAKAKGGKGEDAESAATTIIAGDSVIVRVYGVDMFANPAQNPPDGAFTALVHAPGSDPPKKLSVALQAKAGRSATYDIRHETEKSGEHQVRVMLNGVEINGSPATYHVEPDKAVPSTSQLIPPPDMENLTVSPSAEFEKPVTIILATRDRFGNPCNSGGLRVAGRLHLIKQGANDNTILMPNNHSVTVDDLNDGTYVVKVAIIMPAVVKLVVNMDKDLPGSTGELPPMQLAFVAKHERAPSTPPPIDL